MDLSVKAPKIPTDTLIRRYLMAGQILSQMLFPDDPQRRSSNEIIFRTKFADRWSPQLGHLGAKDLEPEDFR
jgi:hypothetical protein